MLQQMQALAQKQVLLSFRSLAHFSSPFSLSFLGHTR